MRFLHNTSYFLVITFSLIIISCKHEPDQPVPVDPNPPDTNTIVECDPDSVYFINEVLPIFQSSCAMSGCHDNITAQEGINLSTYESIMASGEIRPGNAADSDIYERITDNDPGDRMPPPPFSPLNAEQIASIRDWINQGAKNNECTECDTTNFTFSGSIQPLLNLYCVGCHNANTANGNVRLDNYETVALVAEDGRLLGTVSHEPGFTPMPFNGNRLQECNISQIRKWIESGNPNN